jgi:uroporphyrinogen decarboxylase
MRSKDRVLCAFSGNEPDRVPINYLANPGIDGRLRAHYGVAAEDQEGLLTALGVDFRHADAPYAGPKLHADIPERGIKCCNWGIRRRWAANESGGYWDYCDFPLRDATVEEVAAWPMPSPDDHDYGLVPELCRRHADYAVSVGGPGIADVINQGGMLRGADRILMDLILEDPAGILLTQRRTGIQLGILERTLDAAAGGVDFVWMGEDLGTQRAPLIGMDLYRKVIKPVHQQFIDLAKSHDLPIMVHSCGSSSWVYEEFIEMGVTVVDTLQPEAADMSPAHLKQTYGGRLAFHGCISTAGPVAAGSVGETVASCQQTLDVMMPGGGYCFAPTHQLQDNSPTENVVAMYETARSHGTY